MPVLITVEAHGGRFQCGDASEYYYSRSEESFGAVVPLLGDGLSSGVQTSGSSFNASWQIESLAC